MTMRPLLPALVTGILVLATANTLSGAWSHRLPYFHLLERVRTAQNPNLLFVGNSLLAGHLDEPALVQSADSAGYRPLNSALGASHSPEQELLFDYAVQNHPHIHTVVVGFFDFQLTAPDHTKISDLTGNRMVGIDQRFPVSEVASVYGFGTLDRIELEAMRKLPLAANRANVWKYVELLRRSMASMGMPGVATNSMGRVDDFAALESASADAFDAQARAFLRHPDSFNASYESIFNQANRAGMDEVLVLMPISPSHRATFYARPLWPQYLVALSSLAAQHRIRFIDASNWLNSEQDFADHLHMTQQAAHDFSVRLGGELAGTP